MIFVAKHYVINYVKLYFFSGERISAADRLENVTHTVTRILDGYDIRLRPNFGGEFIFFNTLSYTRHTEAYYVVSLFCIKNTP